MKFCMYNVTTTIKIGGIETFYWEVSKELQNRGYDVEIISGEGKYIKYENIKLKQFSFTTRDKIFDLGNRFRKLGERISFFKNSFNYLKKQNYDYFLIHKPLDFFVAYFMKRLNPNLKVIFVSGGEDFYGFDKFFSKYIDYMFAVSKSNAEIIANRYKREVKILHNGVDIDKFKRDFKQREILRKQYSLENKKVLVSVGRIVGWKGYQLVIEALKELDFYYVVIGDGEYLNTLKDLAKKFNVSNKVLFLGSIDNKELSNYLSMGDIFVQPSIGHEAFGITIIEAMACELPVVASRNGGIVDIVKDNINGYLFEINDIKDMQSKIDLSFTNLSKLSKSSREYIKENFTWKKTLDILLKAIK